jgi:hypothetical protein
VTDRFPPVELAPNSIAPPFRITSFKPVFVKLRVDPKLFATVSRVIAFAPATRSVVPATESDVAVWLIGPVVVTDRFPPTVEAPRISGPEASMVASLVVLKETAPPKVLALGKLIATAPDEIEEVPVTDSVFEFVVSSKLPLFRTKLPPTVVSEESTIVPLLMVRFPRAPPRLTPPAETMSGLPRMAFVTTIPPAPAFRLVRPDPVWELIVTRPAPPPIVTAPALLSAATVLAALTDSVPPDDVTIPPAPFTLVAVKALAPRSIVPLFIASPIVAVRAPILRVPVLATVNER